MLGFKSYRKSTPETARLPDSHIDNAMLHLVLLLFKSLIPSSEVITFHEGVYRVARSLPIMNLRYTDGLS